MTEVKTIKGIISVGKAHPLYNKEIDLYVLDENIGYDNKQTWVRSVEPVVMEHEIFIYDKHGKFLRTEKRPSTMEYIEGWLKK